MQPVVPAITPYPITDDRLQHKNTKLWAATELTKPRHETWDNQQQIWEVLKGYEPPLYELYPVYGLVWLSVWMTLYQRANEETGMSNTLDDLTSNIDFTLETRRTWIVNEQTAGEAAKWNGSYTLIFWLTTVVCACAYTQCAHLWVHMCISSPTWEKMSDLTNFPLTSVGGTCVFHSEGVLKQRHHFC